MEDVLATWWMTLVSMRPPTTWEGWAALTFVLATVATVLKLAWRALPRILWLLAAVAYVPLMLLWAVVRSIGLALRRLVPLSDRSP